MGVLLAENCYDLWLGNSRGNVESYKHVNLTDSDHEYWQFSFHEMGKYDYPAFVDYVLAQTGKNQVIYIGHSQGWTQFFGLNSYNGEISKKIKAAAALGPIMFLDSFHTSVFAQFWIRTNLVNTLTWDNYLNHRKGRDLESHINNLFSF